uniref:Ig-like domain-containing protein n=1 Tax=Cyclopterus lumpus TaxID=8103 RepID=A0A8C2ZKK9_CYCLU
MVTVSVCTCLSTLTFAQVLLSSCSFSFTEPISAGSIAANMSPPPSPPFETNYKNYIKTPLTFNCDIRNKHVIMYPFTTMSQLNGFTEMDIMAETLTLTLVFCTTKPHSVYNVLKHVDPGLILTEPISNVTLRANRTKLMEFKSSAVVTCSVSSGSSLSFLWMNGSSEVKASGRVQLTDGSSTLTIVNVTRYDQGPFSCRVFNPVSNGSSDPVTFTISYGPDNMALTMNGRNTTSFPIGSNLTVLCSAQSSPPAQLQWAIRGELANTTGPLLELFSRHQPPSFCFGFLLWFVSTEPFSGSEQQAVNVMLLPLLLLVGFLFLLPGKL